MTRVVTFDPSDTSLGRVALAIGMFDGVHLGHQTLIAHAMGKAREHGVASCVVTFDRDPDSVVAPERATPHLTTFADRLEFLSALGPDLVLVIPFDRTLAALSPEEFLSGVLLRAVSPVSITVGCDFRFGARAAGTVETLQRSPSLQGVEVTPHELLTNGDCPVTSTRIRNVITEGDVAKAATLLGHPHVLRGIVERGRGVGASLGAPTANLEVDRTMAIPATGVYAAVAEVDGARYPAALTIGKPPSFPDADFLIEVHLLDFEGDLYGAPMRIEFHRRLRGLRPFDSMDELRAAIKADIETVRALRLT